MITVKNVYKTYFSGTVEFPVLKHISLSIKKGEFIAITGRSGSGKSTLLYQLSLLDTPTSGEIYLNDVYTNTLTDEHFV
jgi:putative ABC transport system ATP-binding protein